METREAEVNLVATNVLARNAALDEKLAVMMKEFTAMKKKWPKCGGKKKLSTGI